MNRLPPLDLLLSFEAAARHLSFTRAAAERFVTQSAMSRQMRALEDELGVTLFVRGHRALTLTAEGQRLFATCSATLAQLRETVQALRAPARREQLAVTTTPGLASLWLIPRLAGFTRAHPGVDVRLDTSLERRDLVADDFDLAIRYGRAGAGDGEPLFREAMVPVCAPALRGDPARPLRAPADLRHHTLLQITIPAQSGMPLEWTPWLEAMGLADLQPAATLSFSGYGEAIGAAVGGQGVALGRRPLVDDLLHGGQLVTPFDETLVSPRAYFVVTRPGTGSRPAVQAFARWLHEQAAGDRRGHTPA